MPSYFTEHYNLNQWARTDQVLMDDFNADNAKLDAAIQAVDAKAGSKADQSALEAEIAARAAADETLSATLSSHAQAMTKLGNCQIYSVRYTGSGEDSPQSLTFPERPIIVYLMQGGGAFAPCLYGMDRARTVGFSPDTSFSTSWSGNTLSWGAYAMNNKNGSYQAMALCARS